MMEVLDFEMELAAITVIGANSPNLTEYENLTPLGSITGLSRFPNSFTGFMREMFDRSGATNGDTLNDNTAINIILKQYLSNLAQLLEKYSPTIIANYLGWRTVMVRGKNI